MWNIVEAVGFSLVAIMVAYAVLRDLRTGASGDSMYHYNATENPLGYPLMIATKILGVIFFTAEALYAVHVIGEPMGLARGLLHWMMTTSA